MLRRAEGEIPGLPVMDRTVPERRLAPCGAWRIEEAADHFPRAVSLCSQGCMPSMAAAGPHGLGPLCGVRLPSRR